MNTERRESNKRFRIFAIILIIIGGSFIAFFAAIRLNPSLYRKIFMHATNKTPADLNPGTPSPDRISAASAPDPAFKNFADEVCTAIKNGNETYDIDKVWSEKLVSFSYNGLNSDQQATYDQLKAYLSSRTKLSGYTSVSSQLEKSPGTSLASIDNGRDYYSALLNSYTLSDRSTDYYNELVDVYIESFFSDAQSLTSKKRGLAKDMEKFSFPSGSGEDLVSSLKERSSSDFPGVLAVDYKYDPDFPDISDRAKLFPALARNICPGHLYLTGILDMNIHSGKTDSLRAIIANKSYSTGWDKYAEFYSYDYVDGYDKNVINLRRDYDQIITCLYAKADIMANYYGEPKEKIANYLTGYGIRDAASQTEIYDYVLTHPGQYAATSIGFLEIKDLSRRARLLKGDAYSDETFHRFIVNAGPLSYNDLDKRLNTM